MPRRLPARPPRPDRLAGRSLRGRRHGERSCARAGAERSGALEVFVHSPDRDGLFAAIVATLDRLGLAIQQARVLDGPARRVRQLRSVPSIRAMPQGGRRAALAAALRRSARQVPPGAPRAAAAPASFPHRAAGRLRTIAAKAPARVRTMLSLVCTDRPGLLADVARGIRSSRLRVHDARIATFGERAEDVFQITDPSATARSTTRTQQALREALARLPRWRQ
jgi:[protein-PII] uridylyltransferase